MSTNHEVGYSKSARAKCHAPTSCKDTPLPIGTLRYGRTITTNIGQTVEWRHWGCVTPDILGQMAIARGITGFTDLKPGDQSKIRLAISLRRVDPADIPASAKGAVVAPPHAFGTQNKRNATQADLGNTRTQASTSARPYGVSSNFTQEIEEETLDEPDVVDELYCTLGTSVVGIQYYSGLVGPGEQVVLVREPQNKFDRNAIQVKNISRVQVGHVPKNVATKLAPLLDRKLVTVEGVINDGNMGGSNSYTLSLSIRIYGASDKRKELEPQLIWATPHQKGFPNSYGAASSSRAPDNKNMIHKAIPAPPMPSASQANSLTPAQMAAMKARQEAIKKQEESLRKAAELQQMINQLEKVDDESRRTSLLDTLCSTNDVLSMPVYENPPSIASGELSVDLLKHQLQALKWCIESENPVLPKKETDKPVQFWQLRKRGHESYYFNIATKTPQTAPPELGRGALCADAMGLGKTLTMIALMLATKKEIDPGFSNSTLIVAPLSVLSNWEKQLVDHCTPGSLTSCVYYGANRGLSAAELQGYDIVITTYQTVAGEYDDGSASAAPAKKKKKTERVLFDVPWKRVILDEGHNIRNPKTKMAKSVCALNVSRRWVLTGTPIINSPKDLGSILTFLQICRPLDNEDFYKRLLLRPLKNGDPTGVELLRALMSHICIRRTKEMQDSQGKSIIELPPVEMIKVPVRLGEEAMKLYEQVERVSQQRLKNIMQSGTSAMVQSNVLSMLTRLRQIALHPGLVPTNYLEELLKAEANEANAGAPIKITPAEKLRLQELLARAIEDSEECPVCFGLLPNDSRITFCAHTFCLACITEIINRTATCPMDRRPITAESLLAPPPPTDLTQRPARLEGDDEEPTGIRAGSSAKIDQLVHLLQLTPGGEKSLVFSQFTSFLDKIVESLDEAGIPYVRFDGQMSAKRRQEAIARFSVPLEDETPIALPVVQETVETPEEGLPMTATENSEAPSILGGRVTRSSRRIISSTPAAMDADTQPTHDAADGDFVMCDGAPPGDDSDDFVDDDDSEIESPFASKKPSKGKGKSASKGKARADPVSNALPTYDSSDANPRVMLLSLKAGAVGLNLTVANNVYLMDPWWQEGIESQAVDRVNRIGQKKNVHVYQLIAENTVESKVLEIQEKKKALIQQAFSGIKRTETQRQQREARLQDIIEMFGMRASQAQAPQV